jgi:hypothetical protein
MSGRGRHAKFSSSVPRNFPACPENFLLANRHLPAIIWGFVGSNTLAIQQNG